MPVSEQEHIWRDLQAKKFAPTYFLHGEEDFYIDQICSFIEENALAEHEKGFNQVIAYGKDTNMGQIVNLARRYPMMADKQVIIIKEFQELSDLRSDEAHKILQKYIENPLESTILVLAHKHKLFDARKALYKSLEKNAVVLKTKKLYDNEVPKWIEKYVQSKHYQITPTATMLLAEFVGGELSRLSSEIEKIFLNLAPKSTIDEATIRKFVGQSKEYTVFDLQKALTEKDILKANKIISFFARNPKDNPIIPIISLLFQFFVKLLLVHQSQDRNERNLAALLAVNPYFVKDYLSASQKYNLSKTVQIIHYLRIADLQSKGVESGNMQEGDILKELVFKILH
ncbi:MAG: DNA polymerase III subunit delta [Thermonemataceae bacterium]|nr:DNA polymerase III subunit delta [Thermonemataceae bacterium]